MESAQLLALFHLTDSSFPTGAFSHSYGLESYTQIGLVHEVTTLIEFLTTRLMQGMARFDLILLREAMSADMDTIRSLDERMSAMITVYELREASIQVGKRFLKSALPYYGGDRSLEYYNLIRTKQVSGHFVIAYGLIAMELGVSTEAALTAYLHAFIVGQATAAMKLVNFGQTRTQQVIFDMQAVISDAMDTSLRYSSDELHVFTPALDIQAMKHEFLFRRLFIS